MGCLPGIPGARNRHHVTGFRSWGRDGIIRKGDHLMSTKSRIYKLLRIWNDASAVKKGKVTKRIVRRAAGKTTGRLLRKLFK